VKAVAAFAAPIVVGVDGTEASLAALRWAQGEASVHGVPLTAVHVSDPRERGLASYAARASHDRESGGASALERLVSECCNLLDVVCIYEVGIPSTLLVRRAIGARMLVLGHADAHRRREGDEPQLHPGPALGPTARACVLYATCPVVVVPVPARRDAHVGPRPEPKSAYESKFEHGYERERAATHAPIIGGRALYPVYLRIPVARG
jgi:nucleotide-binding universal stress UspA family protein